MYELVWKWWLGYGERPLRVLAVVVLILLGLWLLYWQTGTFVLEPASKPPVVGTAEFAERSILQSCLFLRFRVWPLGPTADRLGYVGWSRPTVLWHNLGSCLVHHPYPTNLSLIHPV